MKNLISYALMVVMFIIIFGIWFVLGNENIPKIFQVLYIIGGSLYYCLINYVYKLQSLLDEKEEIKVSE